jgi:hypothetical protein
MRGHCPVLKRHQVHWRWSGAAVSGLLRVQSWRSSLGASHGQAFPSSSMCIHHLDAVNLRQCSMASTEASETVSRRGGSQVECNSGAAVEGKHVNLGSGHANRGSVNGVRRRLATDIALNSLR